MKGTIGPQTKRKQFSSQQYKFNFFFITGLQCPFPKTLFGRGALPFGLGALPFGLGALQNVASFKAKVALP